MNDLQIGVLIGVGIALVARLAYILVVSGGNFSRYMEGQQVGLRWLRDPKFAKGVQDLLEPPPPPPAPKPSPDRILILGLLQREGRLLDFLLEDVAAYSDEQIGAAVRDIHKNCRKALQEHVEIVPVLDKEEGAQVDIPAGFDPSAIRLTGNVTGQPPFKGTLQHHGWRVGDIKIPAPPEAADGFVVQPAEVELP